MKKTGDKKDDLGAIAATLPTQKIRLQGAAPQEALAAVPLVELP
jgi:hypothetical protein